jgi:hypothetical protein
MTSNTRWRKSSFSGAGANDCVEIDHRPERIGIRDSKAPHTHFTVNPRAFTGLLTAVKSASQGLEQA